AGVGVRWLPRLLGTLLIKPLRPASGKRVNAGPPFSPSPSHIAAEIIPRFIEQQDRLLSLMEVTRRFNLDGITITSPVVRFITYSLMDAYRIIVVHEQNHFVQAKRVMEMSGFPGRASFSGSLRT